MSNNTATIKTRENLVSTRTITMTALLAAISYVLAFFEFPVPLSPSFARMDLSDLPALIGAFAFGPVTGVMIELIKNILQLLSTSTGGIGELANFLMGASMYCCRFIYKYKKTQENGDVGVCYFKRSYGNSLQSVMGVFYSATPV